jgi:D-glycero-beta-D-manno-heptose-7-phosphate kinase
MGHLTGEAIDEILERAGALRVVVVGDVMLDTYLSGNVARISPEAPVPVVEVMDERSALGGAANVAANIVALGAQCDLVGVIGADGSGAELRRRVEALEMGGMHGHLIVDAERPTTTKTRVMARHQQVVRFDRESTADVCDETASRLIGRIAELVQCADVLVLEDYNKGVLSLPVIEAALAAARAAGVPTVVDPKFRNFFAFRGATVFKPNVLELAAALGGPVLAREDGWMERARERLGCEHLLVTLGEEGMSLQSRGEATFRIPTVARDVFDVSGAGDTVTACIALGAAAGTSLREAAVLANHAAGIEVGKHGVATVSPDELRSAVRDAQLADILP